MQIRKTCLIISLLALSGCSLFPVSGPQGRSIRNSSTVSINLEKQVGYKGAGLQYAMLKINQGLLHYMVEKPLNAKLTTSHAWPVQTAEGAAPDDILISVGDTLTVTIYEAMSGGLFVASDANLRSGNFIALPAQTITSSGNITVPYAGNIAVANKTVQAVEQHIIQKLKNRAIDPQVVVTINQRGGSEISVLGAVNNAQRYALNFNGEKILDAVARSGGPSAPGHEVLITLQRDGKESTTYFDELVLNPENNIYLKPNDTIYLYREPPYFMMFGAAGLTGKFNFDQRKLSLADALANADGLRDLQADPADVYVFREEKREFVQDIDGITMLENLLEKDIVPTVYHLDMREPEGLFFAQNFVIENKDVIHIGNAETVEVLKLVGLINPSATTTINTRAAND